MKPETLGTIGRYHVLRILNENSLWTEYLAFHETGPGRNEPCCLWLPRPGTIKNQSIAERNLAPLLSLQHHNLERMIDVGKSSSGLFVAYEYQPSRTMEEVSETKTIKDGPLSFSTILYVAAEVLRGLVFLEQRQDEISPAFHGWLGQRSVVLTSEGFVRIRHMGLASCCGLAPDFLNKNIEFAQSELSEAAHVTSVASMILELISPDTPNESGLQRDLPKSLNQILNRVLADPDHRDAGALLSEIERILIKRWTVCSSKDLLSLVNKLFADEFAQDHQEIERIQGLTIDHSAPTFSSSGSIDIIPEESPKQKTLEIDLEDSYSGNLLGSVIDGRYRLLREIGRGASGVVYEAEHLELGTRVAIKMLDREYSRDNSKVERFRREARAAGRIGHPNIVRVIDLGRTGQGRFYFVMDLVRGEDLAQVIIRDGPLGQIRAVDIMLQVCDALESAHEMSVIHRDLKPENIVLSRDASGNEIAQVVDFGLSVTLGSTEKRLTKQGQAVGTPFYMAPEQVRGEPTGPFTDVYASGAILYESLTGLPLFDYETVAETLTAHLHEDPIPPSKRASHRRIDKPLERVVLKALHKDPTKRFQNMKELSHALIGAMAQREDQTSTPLPSPSDSGRPKAKKRTSSLTNSIPGIATVAQFRSRPYIWAIVVFLMVLIGTLIGIWPHLNRSSVSASQPMDTPEAIDGGQSTPPEKVLKTKVPTESRNGLEGTKGNTESSALLIDMEKPESGPKKVVIEPVAAPQIKTGSKTKSTVPSKRPDDLQRQAKQAFKQGNTTKAASYYRQVLRFAPANATAWAGLGRAEFEQGRHTEALRAYTKAVNLRPSNVRYRLLRAGALMRTGKRSEAIAEYEEVLRRDEDNPVAKRILGQQNND